MILICGLERHKIKIFDEVRTENEQKIREKIQLLNNKQNDQKSYDQQIDQMIQRLQQVRDQKKADLQSLFDQILSGIDTKVQEKITNLQVERDRTKVEIETVQNKISEAENMVLNQTGQAVRNDAQFIANQLAVIQTCEQTINNRPTRIDFDPTPSQTIVDSIAKELVETIIPRPQQNRTLTSEEICSIIEQPENLSSVLRTAERYQQARNNSNNSNINNNNDNNNDNNNNNNSGNLTPTRAENTQRFTKNKQISASTSNLLSSRTAYGKGSIVKQKSNLLNFYRLFL